MHSIGTPSITPCSVIPPSCPALSAAPVVVVIGLAGSIPIGRGDPYGTICSVRGPVGVVVQFGVQSFGSEFWVGVLGRSLVRVRRGYTHRKRGEVYLRHRYFMLTNKIPFPPDIPKSELSELEFLSQQSSPHQATRELHQGGMPSPTPSMPRQPVRNKPSNELPTTEPTRGSNNNFRQLPPTQPLTQPAYQPAQQCPGPHEEPMETPQATD